jgi:2'-5' RNA ligase
VGTDRVGGAQIERIRAFFGLPLPEVHRGRLQEFLAACAIAAPAFRWSDPHNLHLTIRFIGSVDRDVVEEIASRLEREPGPAFEVALGGLGTFTRGRLPRVVWLGVPQGIEPLRGLAHRVEALCRAAGLEPETRAFAGHLTLARARPHQGAALPDLPPPPELDPWRARELVLYSSHLGRAGAVHEPIRTVPLAE